MTHDGDLMKRGGPRQVNQWLEEMRIFRPPPDPIAPSGSWRWDGVHLAWLPKARTMMKLWVMNGWIVNPNVSDPDGRLDVGHDEEVEP